VLISRWNVWKRLSGPRGKPSIVLCRTRDALVDGSPQAVCDPAEAACRGTVNVTPHFQRRTHFAGLNREIIYTRPAQMNLLPAGSDGFGCPADSCRQSTFIRIAT
jgi:hypothetical protein